MSATPRVEACHGQCSSRIADPRLPHGPTVRKGATAGPPGTFVPLASASPRLDIHLGRRAGGPCRRRGPNTSSVEGRPRGVGLVPWSPPRSLSHHPHDRIADRRVNDAWLAAAWTDPGTRVLVLSATRFRPVDGRPTWAGAGRRARRATDPAGATATGVIPVAVIADPSMADGQDDWTGLRGAVQTIDETDAELARAGRRDRRVALVHPDRGAHVVLPEQLVGVDGERRLAHAGALHRDRSPQPGAGVAEHCAYVGVAGGVVEERLGDPLRAKRVAGQQDGGGDRAGLDADVGAQRTVVLRCGRSGAPTPAPR